MSEQAIPAWIGPEENEPQHVCFSPESELQVRSPCTTPNKMSLSMNSTHTAESTLPLQESSSDEDYDDDAGDDDSSSQHGSVPPAPPMVIRTEERDQLSPLPSRAQSLRDRRRMMEIQHVEQKDRSLQSLSDSTRTASTANRDRTPKSPFSPTSSSKRKLLSFRRNNKSEDARSNRMIERLTEAENQLEVRITELTVLRQEPGKRRIRAMQERAELKLRMSQIEKTRNFYHQRVQTKSNGPVPMDILKVISDLPKYQPRQQTLTEELDAFVKNLRERDPEEAALMFQEIRDWEDTEELALDVGTTAPDFCLPSHDGKIVDSSALRRRSRLIVVFYHDVNSAMCKMNLTALERLRATFEREGAQLLAIGFEADTQHTANETGAKFPLLADAAGIVATKFGIIRTEEFPILSTFIIDTNGEVLWKYVNRDYTKRPEPIDILEALPSQTKRRLKFFRRQDS